MKYININVKEEDVTNAGHGSGNCPVAQSIMREHNGVFVEVFGYYIGVGNVGYTPSGSLSLAIERYDNGQGFKTGTYRAYLT